MDSCEIFDILQHKDVRAVRWADLVGRMAKDAVALGCGTLVIDTFAAFGGIVGTEENNAGDIRQRMSVLRQVAQEDNLAVLLLRHAGKSGRARGSSQFEADADIVLTLKRPEGNQPGNVRALEGMGRFEAIPKHLDIELIGDEGYVRRGGEGRTQSTKARDAILRLLPGGRGETLAQTKLFKKLDKPEQGVPESTVRRALEEMVEEGLIRRAENPVRFWKPDADPEGGHHQAKSPPGEFGGGPDPVGAGDSPQGHADPTDARSLERVEAPWQGGY